MNPLRHKFLPVSFGVSVIGLVFSVYNILNGFLSEQACETNCSVFADFTFMGFSLWWLSTLVFALILILSLFGFAYCIRIITAAALFCDLFLFVIMLKTAMCIMCVGAGVLFALSYYAIRYENRRPIEPYPKTLLLTVWGILFIALLGSALNASQKAFPLVSAEKATTNVFFSPSCAACKKLIAAEHGNRHISWYPVEENENDIWRIIFIKECLQAGDTLHQALLKAEEAKPEQKVGLFDALDAEYFRMQFAVWKNSAIVKRRSAVLPYMEVFGAPADLSEQDNSSTIRLQNSAQMQNNAVRQLIGRETALCGDEAKPCGE